MPTLRDLLADGRVHVVDGAMGTVLYGRGVFVNVCYDELNLRQPDLVRRHPPRVRASRRRGARDQHLRRQPAQAGHVRPRGRDRADQRRGGRGWRARRPATRAAVLGAHRPARRPARAVRRALAGRGLRDVSSARSSGLLDGGVDGFILETFSDVAELGAGAAGRPGAAATCPIIAQMTVGTDGKTHYGTDPAVFGPELGGDGRGRHRRQLLGGSARRARGGREAGAGR